jgi:ABC-type multidrug transport system fused ATPase/permease subunit
MRDFFAAIFAIMYASMGAGSNNQFMVDVGQAKNAAKNIFKILDSQDEFQINQKKVPDLSSLIKNPLIQGNIEFKSVIFKYIKYKSKNILFFLSLYFNKFPQYIFIFSNFFFSPIF